MDCAKTYNLTTVQGEKLVLNIQPTDGVGMRWTLKVKDLDEKEVAITIDPGTAEELINVLMTALERFDKLGENK